MFGMLMGGYLLTRPVDDGSAASIASEVGFNHVQKYQQIHGGSGPQALSASAQAWSSHVGGKFDSIAQRLEEATSKAGVAWQGAAAEAHGTSMAPLSSFVRDAKDVSTAVGTSTEHQVDNYTAVRDTMPEPKKITATDSLLEKGGAWLIGSQTDLQRQEQEAMERAQEAQRVYGTYNTGSGNVSSSLPRYPEAPKLHYTDQPAASGGRVGVDTGGGYTGNSVTNGGSTYSGGSGQGSPGNGSDLTWNGGNTDGNTGGSGSGSGSGSGPGGPGSGSGSGGNTGGDGPPAENDSAWTTPPPATGGSTPLPGTATGSPGGGSGGGALGVIGGGTAGGSRGGTGSGAGRGGTGRGGSGSGYGRGGSGSGSGVGGRSGTGSGSGLGAGGRSGSGLGAGGRSGSGMPSTSSAYSTSTSNTGARGGLMGGAGARGTRGEDDEEHENKYMVDTDEAWEDLGLPRTAPPVIGGDLEPPQR